jgi:hypothetical protein
METVEILGEFNFCYIKIQGIIQSKKWQELVNRKDADAEMKTHLGDVLHYLSEAMGCVEQFIEVQSTECK